MLANLVPSSKFTASKLFSTVLMPQAAPGVETIDTFEVVGGVCTNTPKDTFSLGDTVCARVENAPLRSPVAARRVNFNNTAGVNSQSQDVTTDPQTFTFTLPTADTTVVDGENIDNRGIWSVSTNALDNGTRAIAYFSVTDPQNSAADVVIYSASASGVDPVAPGGSAGISLWVSNNGPDAAQDVHVTQQVPNNLTFVSATSDSGPSFNCSESGGVVDCSLASLPSGQKATFTINYTVSSSAPNSLVTVRSEIASDQEDPRLASNTADARLEIRGGSGPAATCGLACPADLRVTADTTNGNGDPGAIVNFSGNIEPVGEDCGAITSTPASGSFFPVGDTVVEVTSAGGGSCSFTVTVTNIAPPTISCGANIGVTAADGECDAEVNVTAPTGTADDAPATAEGSRSDGQALTARYPAGTTTITWTITDSINRTASCQQTVTVTVNDTTPPTITAPPDVTVSTPDGTSGNCGVVVGEGALGTPTTDDNCSASLNVSRTGVPSGNFFPVGTTTITYTVKDSANNTATATQKVTVIETTAPHIAAPPDASYTCLSEVPAANPSQATSGVVLDENGNPLPPGPPSDNCGTPVVTVTETTSGAGNPSSPLIITRVFTATDAAGNSASSTQTITVIDPTPPTISCPADITVYLPLNSTAVSTPVNFSASGSDNCGSPNITYSQAPGSNFPVGTTAVTATATDAGGNSVSCTFNVTVLYNFTGFFSPVNNLPTFNVVNAGRAIPVKFSLSGNKGLNIFATGSPASGTIACNSSDPAVDLLGTVTAGGSSLSYDASSDQYNYVWKTESSWAGTCRQLVLTLNDGSVHRANFKFK